MFQQAQVSLDIPFSWISGKLTSLIALLLLFAGVSPRLAAQASEWTWRSGSNTVNQAGVYGTLGVPAAGNVPGARDYAVTWTDSSGNLWLFGGYDASTNWDQLNDLWRFTPSTGEWTWVSGSNTVNQPGIYGTLGVPAPGNGPGSRTRAVAWVDSNSNLWLFGGNGYDANGGGNDLNDLWRFTPSTGEWTWIGGGNAGYQPGVYGTLGVPAPDNVPPGRGGAAGWTDSSGNLWLFGGSESGAGSLNDLWKYTPSSGAWTWMGGSNSMDQPGVYGTLGMAAASNVPGNRSDVVTWTDSSGNLWLFGGWGVVSDGQYLTGVALNDLWRYSPPSGEWTWMSGSNSWGQSGVYGSKGVPAAGNVPGARYHAVSWTDPSGNLWLFGGGNAADLNDLWRYTLSTGEWTWMSGSNTGNQPGVYGTLGVPAGGNVPGARSAAVSWTDLSGNLWLFGGTTYENSATVYFNDLWKYTPAATLTPSLTAPAPGIRLSGSSAAFSWSNPGNLAQRFVLRLGTTALGSSDVYSGAATTGTTEQVSAIPTDGAYLYATLWYYLNGKWQYVTSTYTEAGTPTPPALTTPAPGSTLPGSTVTFGWSPGTNPTRYVLRLGTTGFGSMDVYSGAATTGTSVQVTTVPTKGAKLYATLWYYLNGKWQYANATYTEAGL
jgi:hypothetical protein